MQARQEGSGRRHCFFQEIKLLLHACVTDYEDIPLGQDVEVEDSGIGDSDPGWTWTIVLGVLLLLLF